MSTTENNKLIAEFLGFIAISEENFLADNYKVSDEDKLMILEATKYHSDWNWLMEIVEKIESLGANVWVVKNKVKVTIIGELAQKLNNSLYDTEFEGYDFEYYTQETKIEAVYNACLEFIKWHNSAKKDENNNNN